MTESNEPVFFKYAYRENWKLAVDRRKQCYSFARLEGTAFAYVNAFSDRVRPYLGRARNEGSAEGSAASAGNIDCAHRRAAY
ncbi:hypothetical protein [Paraburkholderia sp. 40]|uniref:hypothetical protein n=1 Tax=Paraburkholderia sp. 40 TaxID=2991059 RepID=UPI003D2108EE